MLTSIELTNIKAVGTSGPISLAPLTVFIGRNGSGKSSVLEALELLAIATEHDLGHVLDRFQRGRDILRCWSPGVEGVVSVSLDPEDVSAGEQVKYVVTLGSSDDGEDLRVVSECLEVTRAGRTEALVQMDAGNRLYQVPSTLTRPSAEAAELPQTTRESSPGWVRVGDEDTLALKHFDENFSRGAWLLRRFLERTIVLRLEPHAVGGFGPRTKFKSRKLLDPAGTRTAELIGSMDEEGRRALVEKLQYVIANVTEIAVHEPTGPADRRFLQLTESVATSSYDIPGWVLSDGTRRLTAILSLLLRSDPPPLVVIEEVENGFDPWTLKFLVEELVSAAERGVQIIITSHSPFLMNLLDPSAFRFVRRTHDVVTISPVEKPEHRKAIFDTLGVGDLYKGGLIDG